MPLPSLARPSSLIDPALMLLYFVASFAWVAWSTRRRAASAAAGEGERDAKLDYLLAGRRLTLPAFTLSMVASWYGAVLGVGEYSFRYGLSNWLVFGVPYYLAAGLFAVFLAGRARKAQALTLPEQIQKTYGPESGLMASGIVFFTSIPAAELVALAILLQVVLGLPFIAAMAAATAFTVLLIWRAGLRAVVRSHALQFVLMFGGFLFLLPMLVAEHGFLPFLTAHTPTEHWTWTGGRPLQSVLVWYFIALATLVEPIFYQRCFAARSPQVARWGLFASIGCWIAFDFLTTFTGLYARALLTDLPAARAAEAYPILAQRFLPVGLCGLFFVSMTATVLSSLDSGLFVSATTLGRDFLGRTRRFESRIPRATQLGLLLSALLAFALAWLSKSVVDLWHGLGSISTATLLLPVLGAFIPRLRMSRRGAMANMALVLSVTVVWLAALNVWDTALLGIEPIFAGLGTGLLVWGVDRWLVRPTPTPEATLDPP
ncbi:MAG: sodium:solute symporter family protein [Myxococcales bacterium]|nr:sodium:solute symporter family protein [Myxococcales bacterium]